MKCILSAVHWSWTGKDCKNNLHAWTLSVVVLSIVNNNKKEVDGVSLRSTSTAASFIKASTGGGEGERTGRFI